MLHLIIAGTEQWDAAKEEFVYTKPVTICLEHSLVSVSKWESRWLRSFLDEPPKTRAEELDYIRCMTTTQNVPPEVYASLSAKDLQTVQDYINAPMTATTVRQKGKGAGRGPKITSELIYYWMVEFGIPFECQKWHLNRLMTLIRVCDAKSQAPKKRSAGDILRENAALNKQRRAALHTKG